jgi:hypothetical protein
MRPIIHLIKVSSICPSRNLSGGIVSRHPASRQNDALARKPKVLGVQLVVITKRCFIKSFLLRGWIMHRRSRPLVLDGILPVQHQTLGQEGIEADTDIENLFDESYPDIQLAHDELHLHTYLDFGQDVVVENKPLGRLRAEVYLVWSRNIAVCVVDDGGPQNDGAHGLHIFGLAFCLEQLFPELLLFSGRAVNRNNLVDLMLSGGDDSDLGRVILSYELLQLIILGSSHYGEAKYDQLRKGIKLLGNEVGVQSFPSRLGDLLRLGLRLVELLYTTIAEQMAGSGIERVRNNSEELVYITQIGGGDITDGPSSIDLRLVFRADVVLENIV